MRQLAVHILFLLIMQPCFAQEGEWDFSSVDISTSGVEGTRNFSLISGAVQDKNGFIWVSTHNGMVGYDGQSIFPFADKIALQVIPYTTFYQQMKIDSFDNIWLFSRYRGTIFINAEGTKMTKFDHPESMDENHAYFSDVIFTSDTTAVFSSTDFRLFKYFFSSKRWEQLQVQNKPTTKADLTCGYLIQDPNQSDVFYVGSQYGIAHYDWDESSATFYPLPDFYENHRVGYLAPIKHFDGEILFGGFFNRGIERFDPKERKWLTSITPENVPNGKNFVMSFADIDDDNLLVGQVIKSKIGKLTKMEDGTYKYSLIHKDEQSDRLRFDQQIFKSSNGQYHLLGQYGITTMYPHNDNFNFYRLTPPGSDKNNWQRSFLQLPDPHKFLLGTYYGDGLIIVDWKEKKNKIISFKARSGYFNYDAHMWSLAPSTENYYWIGTDQGILKADIAKEKIWPAEEMQRHQTLDSADVRFLSHQKNFLWISTLSQGNFIFNYQENSIYPVPALEHCVVNQIVPYEGKYLMATTCGVKIFNPEIQQVESHDLLDTFEVHATDILQLGDSLWIATKEKGLYNLSLTSKSNLSAKLNAYPNPEMALLNFQHKLLFLEDQNTILLNSASGYSIFDLTTDQFINYLLYDGIGFTGKNKSILARLYDGTVINGANRYFQYFDPNRLKKNVEIPNPYIKEMTADGAVKFQNKINNQSIVLESGTTNITFKIGAINYNVHPVNYFQYRLTGLSDQWTDWSTDDYVNFSNLKGGDYAFEYKVANKLFEPAANKLITLQIDKKFTEKVIFKLLLAVGLFTILYAWIKYRDHQINRENKLRAEYQTEINELQMNALQLQMNPHFVFNSINSINYYIIKNDRDKASNYLAKFSRLIRLILENSKQKLISLEEELEAIRLYLEIEQVRFEGKFVFDIQVSDDVHLSSTQIPPLILQPYVENAIWHGLMHKKEIGHLLIKIQSKGSNVQCIIEDDGIGRPASAAMNTGKGMKKQSLGTKITSNRLAYVEKIYGIKTDVETIDLKHMDGSSAGTRVVINSPKLKPTNP